MRDKRCLFFLLTGNSRVARPVGFIVNKPEIEVYVVSENFETNY